MTTRWAMSPFSSVWKRPVPTWFGSDNVGEHTVYLGGPGERPDFTVRCQSRDNNAAGALRAAPWVLGRTLAIYS